MSTAIRRYDIDWVRVIAIGLLLLYHVAIAFQSWGVMIGFIATKKPWASLWIPMTMLNVWRIPLLFFVSGMGVYFAIQNRNWKQLLQERASRILLPLVFGMLAIVPISTICFFRIWINIVKILCFTKTYCSQHKIPMFKRVIKSKVDLTPGLTHFYP